MSVISCSEIRSSRSPSSDEQLKRIDRKKTCPMLIRVFPSQGRHHSLEHFKDCQSLENEIHLYTWMDATLQELCECMTGPIPAAAHKGTHMVFAHVFPDESEEAAPGSYAMREIGVVCCGAEGLDNAKTLRQAGFCPGDFLDVAVLQRRRPRR